MNRCRDRRRPAARRAARLGLEPLEPRTLLAVVSIDAGQVVRPVDTQLLGVNVDYRDPNLNTSETQQMVQAAGLTFIRFPGGSGSDVFQFNNPASYSGPGSAGSMAGFVASIHGQAVVTLDYGSGSPQEAAAFLAYLNAPLGNTTPIGNGQVWNDSTSSWQTVDWQNAGYWASLRAAAPLAQDDGLNFLRLDHPAPFGFHDFEVGNEEYGSWETDHHTIPHDPATYVAFAAQFAGYAAQIDPSISIGLDTGSPGSDYNNWIANVLQQSAAQGFLPGFLSDHNYVQTAGNESDSNLLFDTVSDDSSIYGWVERASEYQALLTQYFGSAGQNVELLATEFNSVNTNPGKQTTSLVNGLFVADSLGVLMETPYDGADFWDLNDGYNTGGNNASSLYGWRQGGDFGMIGISGSPPASGPYVPYPTYFAEQLASKIIQPGGNVVQAASNDPNLTAYAVLEADGHLDLMVINKDGSSALTGQFQVAGFQPSGQAQVWQYGEAQDTAQSQTSNGQSALANFSTTLSLSGSSFNYSFPAYSMTVLDLSPVGNTPPTLQPIPNQTILPNQTSITVGLQGLDPDGDTLTDSAQADSLEHQLRVNLGLSSDGNLYTNWGGKQAKWIPGNGGAWYFILPNGAFYRWNGSATASGSFVALLPTADYTNPSLLYDAPSGAHDATLSLAGSQLTITPAAGYSGTLVVTASVSDGTFTASQSFNVTVMANTPPTLQPIPNQTISLNQPSLTVTLQGSDTDGAPLTYSAQADSLEHQLRVNLGLFSNGDLYTNWAGEQEKWMQGSGGTWYFILPSGAFYLWDGSNGASGSLVATLPMIDYDNPSLLYDAQSGSTDATLSLAGNQLTITPAAGYSGTLVVTATVSDGTLTASQTFKVAVMHNPPPTLQPIPNQTIGPNQTSITVTLQGSDPDGDSLTYWAQAESVEYQLRVELGLYSDGNLYYNWAGEQEKWMQGSGGAWYFILPSGAFYLWNGGANLSGTLIATLPTADYANPSLLYDAQPATIPVTLSLTRNQLTITPSAGYTGTFVVIVNVSDGYSTVQQTFQVTVT